jgi:PhzF family phenazine biosynthesis protein
VSSPARLPYYIVNAFSDSTFGGNPAAVMLLDEWLTDAQLQALAAQHNLSETAFLVRQSEGVYELRWFTPVVEVPLCGHATLAAAHVLARELGASEASVRFKTRFRGELVTRIAGDLIAINLPAVVFEEHLVEQAVARALGAHVLSAARPSADPWQILYELESEQSVRTLAPDITALVNAAKHCVIVTAPGHEVDFVSRMFGPHYGVDEDPVTGSAHCLLAPFWSERLGETTLSAWQCSARGGRLSCHVRDDRVELAGQAVTFAVGEVVAPISQSAGP